VDGSAYSTAAVALGIRWAQRHEAVLVGLGVIDVPTTCRMQPVPLGGSPYKAHRDADQPLHYHWLSHLLEGSACTAHRDTSVLADAGRTVGQCLERCARRCAAAEVVCQVLQDVGLPAERMLLEAQQSDLILLGQQTFFHGETPEKPDDTLHTVVKQSPRPVVTVPRTLPGGQAVVVAYDGSLQATRALQLFQAVWLDSSHEVHVVCVDPDQEAASRCVARAVDFLHQHDVVVQAHALATSASPAHVLLEQVRQVDASLLVMGAYGRSTLREFLGHSVTRILLQESPVPLFLSHEMVKFLSKRGDPVRAGCRHSLTLPRLGGEYADSLHQEGHCGDSVVCVCACVSVREAVATEHHGRVVLQYLRQNRLR
jgi:nucleotide-binding universal stress UspA family protein